MLSGVPASSPSGAGDTSAMVQRQTADPVACPYCGSTQTTLENLFGPTQCRSIRHCAACRQPFEAFKPI